MQAFFRITIKGDELNPQELQRIISEPSYSYLKGCASSKFGSQLIQKTNRWVYDVNKMCKNTLDVQAFLTEQLKRVLAWKKILDDYVKRFKSCIDLIIYADDKTYLTLSKANLKALSQIGMKFTISFH